MERDQYFVVLHEGEWKSISLEGMVRPGATSLQL